MGNNTIMEELVNPNKLVSVQEAAEEYGYSRIHLSRLAKEGKLKAWHIGNSWITTREAIEAYIESAPAAGRPPTKTRKRK